MLCFRVTSVTLFIPILALALSGLAIAQNTISSYPSRPVTVVVPFAPGAGTGTETSVYAQKLSAGLGHSFVVDYKPGAGSTIGSTYVAKSAPDGYTLMSASPSNGVAPLLYKNLSYDPIKDFAYISMMSKRPSLLLASTSAPVKSVAEYRKRSINPALPPLR